MALRVEGKKAAEAEEDVCVEENFSIYLNDRFITDLTASPNQLEELGAGYVVCEGIAEKLKAVRVSGKKIYVYAEGARKFEPHLRSSGSKGSKIRKIKKVNSNIKLTAEDVRRFTKEIESELWRKTGGVHCSALFCGKKLMVNACDMGRHNTVDKVVGFALLNSIDLSSCAIACTGRQPKGMIFKAANAGVPIVISKAAPTDRGIIAAEEAGITLVCFSRGNRFNVYTHAERIRV